MGSGGERIPGLLNARRPHAAFWRVFKKRLEIDIYFGKVQSCMKTKADPTAGEQKEMFLEISR
jgi:hypothetical protein